MNIQLTSLTTIKQFYRFATTSRLWHLSKQWPLFQVAIIFHKTGGHNFHPLETRWDVEINVLIDVCMGGYKSMQLC